MTALRCILTAGGSVQFKTATPRALQQARQLGFDGSDDDVLSALRDLVRHSAPLRHRDANRRNGSYLMRVDGGLLQALFFVRCDTCLDRGIVPQFEPCRDCDCQGLDVDRCPGRKTVPLPCPDCQNSPQGVFQAPYGEFRRAP